MIAMIFRQRVKITGGIKMNENRKHILDFIKGLCIIFVIITHFSWSDKERLYPVFPYLIDMAVPIFMVISGYLWASSLMLKTTTFTDAYKMDYIMPRLRRYLFPFTVAFIVEIVPYYIFVNKGGGNCFCPGRIWIGKLLCSDTNTVNIYISSYFLDDKETRFIGACDMHINKFVLRSN